MLQKTDIASFPPPQKNNFFRYMYRPFSRKMVLSHDSFYCERNRGNELEVRPFPTRNEFHKDHCNYNVLKFLYPIA